jgi:hypothetical protein
MLSIGSYTDNDTTYIAAKILPRAKAQRTQFHLALLLDTSGSMDGDRIKALQRTLHLLVDALVDKDCLTIISYSSEAAVLANGKVLSSGTRSELHTIIDDLRADGGTNMEAAIVALRDLTLSVDSVFILTDGHVNQGITGGSGLKTLLNRSVSAGTPVNTLGFGSDHNSHMLRDMAMRSCGTYTYADKDELLPAIIGDIVGGLQSTVGKQGKLTIPEGWTCKEIGLIEDGYYNTGTLIADKPQWVVLSAPAGTAIPSLTFTWLDGHVPHMISYTTSVVSAMDVAAQRDRCTVAKAFVEASDAVEQRNIRVARMVLQDVKAELDKSIAKNATFVVQLYAQIDQMLEELQRATPAAVSSRMASGAAVLGNQRGIMSGGGDPRAFSSPLQIDTQTRMTTRYTQEVEDVEMV